MPKIFSLKFIFIPILLILFLVGVTATYLEAQNKQEATQTVVPEKPFGTYTPPQIPYKDIYTIIMVGDSMTEALGPHGGKLSELLNKLYKSSPGNQRIVIDNYATGSTNLLGLQDAMKQKKPMSDKVYEPVLSRQFDVILIESFGYNPLSELGLEKGLKKQTETLDSLMKLLTKTHPDSVIVFVATIAPNKATYAKEISPGQSAADRSQQAEERMAYIQNHMAFATEHHIPLIDIYNKSLTPLGDGDLTNINPSDHIHPSFEGVDFISKEIANYIYDTQLLPK